MANNQPLILTSLDFDTLKSQFQAFLQGQTQFLDYDFEAANMNVLMSLLSYNTYLNAFYLNMVASEAFLDSAQLYDSVVSKVKLINYLPTSYASAEATVDLQISSNQGYTQFTIPKGTQFSGVNSNGAFQFVTAVPYVKNSTGNTFSVANVAVYEGSYINETWVASTTGNTNLIFSMSNPNIDVSSINVTVYEDNGATTLPYVYAPNFFGVNSTSQVFFLQAYRDGFQLVFGDDVFGRTPQNGATILATYRITSGDAGNAVGTFSIDQDLGAINGGTLSANITTVNQSTGGSLPQTMDSIKFRAPRAYEAQDRAITKNDYEVLILDNFKDIKSVAVYDGETITGDRAYGTTFISPITQAGTFLSDNRKTEVVDFIQDKMTLGFDAVVVDPQIINLLLTVVASYDDTITNLNAADIETILVDELVVFNSTKLAQFKALFSTSQLSTALQQADESIITIDPTVKMYSVLAPTLSFAQASGLTFRNAILPGTVSSTSFQLSDGKSYSITDFNPNNNTFVVQSGESAITNSADTLYLRLNDPNVVQYTKIGNVDYSLGTISLQTMTVVSFLDSAGILITVEPAEPDLKSSRNIILEIDMQNSDVSAVAASQS